MSKTIVVYNPGRFNNEVWTPALWCQAKTYYEKHSCYADKWNWAPCYADAHGDNFDEIVKILHSYKPDVFAISLYVWNYQLAHRVAMWVKENYPNCIVISGGPHQYYKHDINWFNKHQHLDASLPSDSYGEICLLEILDQLAESDSVNWNQVTDMVYPSANRSTVLHSRVTSSRQSKKKFDYTWSAYSSQIAEMKDYVAYAKGLSSRVLSIIETTRGCPYGCTYCDWGGGINTAILQKPIDAVKADIDALCNLDLTFLYFADANFGILGDRDVEIITYLARRREETNQRFKLGYGGFAKTKNKLDTIRQVLDIDIQHQLSVLGEIKISLQSIDSDVLRRIDRKNIELDDYLTMVKSVSNSGNLPVYIELIYGLPGMTIDKFYSELNVFGSKQLSIQWYPWILLPEAPAYSQQYRQQEGIVSITKDASWWAYEDDKSNNEIVIQTSTYSSDDYFEMLMSSCLYKMIVQGGYFKDSVAASNLRTGNLVKRLYDTVIKNSDYYFVAKSHWDNVVLDQNNTTQGCFIDVNNTPVFMGLYLAAIAFTDTKFNTDVANWLHAKCGVPDKVVKRDLGRLVTDRNYGTTCINNFARYSFKKKTLGYKDKLTNFLMLFTQFHHTGNIMRSTRRLFGVIPLD